MAENGEKIFSVTGLTRSIRNNLLANNTKLQGVWIEGEVSGNRLYSSGHRYFTLKDDTAQISCVLFAHVFPSCADDFRAVFADGESAIDGHKIQVEGELDLNMSRGQYSLKIRRARLSGAGDKMAQFNAFKARLDKEGLNKLDHPELRRPLPFLPHRVGVVTSPDGAVIHDICTVLTRRFPNIEIRLFPVKVQGADAARDIAAGVAWFDAQAAAADAGDADAWRADVLIVGRGGGSAEDLWAFNEEEAVYAVARARVPVISAVGHESDFTLCDWVADLRAGTPSIAAERAVPVKRELAARVRDLAARVEKAPRDAYENLAQRLDWASGQLAAALKLAAARIEQRIDRAALRLEPPLRAGLQRAEARVEQLRAKVDLLSPFGILERGYSITLDAQGHAVTDARAVAPGARLRTRLARGQVVSVAETAETEADA